MAIYEFPNKDFPFPEAKRKLTTRSGGLCLVTLLDAIGAIDTIPVIERRYGPSD